MTDIAPRRISSATPTDKRPMYGAAAVRRASQGDLRAAFNEADRRARRARRARQHADTDRTVLKEPCANCGQQINGRSIINARTQRVHAKGCPTKRR